ncbi:hypothetical protein NC652_004919 [Populus alba x Populus x berolinensis]|nr:hypothetical protein NC652_004919 [Populus alba x Populus x berolinensis]
MVPSGPPTPIGGAQSVSPSLLRSNSGMLGAQGGPLGSQTAFPSLVSPRTQFNNMSMLGNVPNMSSLLNQSFGNGGPNPGLPGPGSSQRGNIDTGAESDPLSNVGHQFSNPSGNQLLPDQQQSNNLKHKISSMVSNQCNSSLALITLSRCSSSTNFNQYEEGWLGLDLLSWSHM